MQNLVKNLLLGGKGRAIAQKLSRRLTDLRSGRQSGTGAGFLRVLRFPLQILIPPTVQ
jgi:hypothetical protein